MTLRLSSSLFLLASLATLATTSAQTITGRVLDELSEAPLSTAAING
jgi:hypothetical protein